MSMKHTPGPWSIVPADDENTEFEVWADKECISTLVLGKDNSLLIACAPDLLQALSALIDATTAIYDGQSEDYPELVKAVEDACKVYERATR